MRESRADLETEDCATDLCMFGAGWVSCTTGKAERDILVLRMPKRLSPLSLVLALVAFVVIGLAVAISYLMILKALGRGGGMDGLALVASIVIMPAAGGLFGGILWLPATLFRDSRGKPLSAIAALGLGLSIGLLLSFIFTGPGGFRLKGGAPLMNYFLPLIAGLGSWVGTIIVNRMRK